MRLRWSFPWLATVAIAIDSQVPIDLQQPTTEPLTLDAIPLLGFGTWNLKDNCTEAVSHAIQIGYRHIDAAAIYGNENYVGLGIADGLLKTGLKREDLCRLFSTHSLAGLPLNIHRDHKQAVE
jgi:alcohol dehydrogenase (NADP+)